MKSEGKGVSHNHTIIPCSMPSETFSVNQPLTTFVEGSASGHTPTPTRPHPRAPFNLATQPRRTVAISGPKAPGQLRISSSTGRESSRR